MGKKNTAAPDYTPLANASNAANERMSQLGQDQLDFSKKQYEQNNPLMQDIARKQGLAMDQQMAQGKDYFDYNKSTFRPLEQQMVADAQNFDTDAMRNQLATKAAADSSMAFGQQNQANERRMASMGVNPNSGRFQGMAQQSGLMQSANRAGAMTGARERAQQMGHARKMDAASLGRGLSGASSAAYGGANNAGNSAVGNYGQAGQQYMGGMAQGAGTIGSGYSMQIGGLGNVLNNQTQMSMNAADNGVGSMVGGLAGAAASYYGSDIRLKENIELAGFDEATGLNLYDFNYKWNSKRFRGVMAQEVIKDYPEAVHTMGSGWLAVDYGVLGLEMKEVH
jgi:hypothetical protein